MKLDEIYIQQELERILPHRSVMDEEDYGTWCVGGYCNCGVSLQREQVMKLILEVANGSHQG